MEKVTINSQNGYIEIESEDVKSIIESFDGVGEVRNISSTVGKGMMAFDVALLSDYVEKLLESAIDEVEYLLEEEQESAILEQAEYISDALVDNIKEFIENRYNTSKYNGAYDIYKASLEEGIALTLTISFGDTGHGRLYRLASSINDGKSEFR